MLYHTCSLYPELAIIPIGTVDNPHSLDVFGGEGGNLLLLIAYQPQAPYPTPVGEGDVLAVRFDLPSCLLIFYASIIMLELRIALLTGLVVLAIVIETGNREPGPISRSLSSLRVETGSKGVLMGKSSTVALQVILVDAPRVHCE